MEKSGQGFRRQAEGRARYCYPSTPPTAPGPRSGRRSAVRHRIRDRRIVRTPVPVGLRDRGKAERSGAPAGARAESWNRSCGVREKLSGLVGGPGIRRFHRARPPSPDRTVSAGHRDRGLPRPARAVTGAARVAGFTTVSGNPGRVRTLLGPEPPARGCAERWRAGTCCRRGPVRPPGEVAGRHGGATQYGTS